jgi:predicted nucleotidyltransferase
MQEGSLNAIISEMLERILAVVQPRKVVLFGSASRGEMRANSDIDLLVIVPTGMHRRRTAQKIYLNMIGAGFAADIVVVTEDDVELYKDRNGMIIMPALADGRVLYAAA